MAKQKVVEVVIVRGVRIQGRALAQGDRLRTTPEFAAELINSNKARAADDEADAAAPPRRRRKAARTGDDGGEG